ncbi:MAG: hypothetical protein PHQ89_01570 [Bacilli bacterium]|nr:hypothetical protein [Bacilli bacterium]
MGKLDIDYQEAASKLEKEAQELKKRKKELELQKIVFDAKTHLSTNESYVIKKGFGERTSGSAGIEYAWKCIAGEVKEYIKSDLLPIINIAEQAGIEVVFEKVGSNIVDLEDYNMTYCCSVDYKMTFSKKLIKKSTKSKQLVKNI